MKLVFTMILGMAIAFAAASPAWASPADGKKTFEGQKCNACHYTDGPAREKSIADQLAKKGPELWYAGSKFQRPWLEGWLAKPAPIRALAYNSLTEKNKGDHPKLAGADAKNVADFLMRLTTNEVKAGKIKPKKSLKGRQVFTKKMPCTGCHRSAGRKGKVSGGISGPTLVGASKRLNPDWIFAYLKNPTHFKPFKPMPTFADILKAKDIKNVATYVATLK
ncbi:MAG: cytochrome c [Rhodospirillales bacterium]|nr:cytochrome c [Rhodospirillales bacterium]